MRAATGATYAAFIVCGFAFASWASRIPQVRDQLHLSPSQLGLLLLSIAAGSVTSLPLAGIIIHRWTSRRTVAVMSVVLAVGLGIAAVGYLIGVVPVVIGLFVVGFANGGWDVAMNVQGATVERQLGRSIMPRFHAGYSFGTVAGALAGVLMVALHVPVPIHLGLVAAVVAIVVPLAVRGFVPDVEDSRVQVDDEPVKSSAASALSRWREPRTLMIGLVVFAFAFAEGSGDDWIGVSLIDGYDSHAAVATLGLAAFLTAMTTVRWFGTGLLDRFGRVAVIRGLTIVAAIGVLVFVFSPSVQLAFVGVLLWGCGASLGFPVGMSAAADEPAAAAGRVSVVASIGYCAFLAGPPLIGLVGNHESVLRALTAVAVVLAVAALFTGALRPPQCAQERRSRAC